MRHRGPTRNEMFRTEQPAVPRHRGFTSLYEEGLQVQEMSAFVRWCSQRGYLPDSTRSAAAYEREVGFLYIGDAS